MSPKLKNLLFTLFVLISCVVTTYAGDKDPPAPTRDSDIVIPPPPGLPVDDYIPFLLIAGVLLGIWIKYRIISKVEVS